MFLPFPSLGSIAFPPVLEPFFGQTIRTFSTIDEDSPQDERDGLLLARAVSNGYDIDVFTLQIKL